MAATVLDIEAAPAFARLARRRSIASVTPAGNGFAEGLPSRVHFWRGAAGIRHLFSVYSLLECPPLGPSAYLLVRRGTDGRRDILASGTVEHSHAPANLATVRYQAACLGANEVHVASTAGEPHAREALAAEFATAAAAVMPPAQTDAYCNR